MDTPIWAVCDIGRLTAKMLLAAECVTPFISSSRFNCEILNIADGLALDM
jgi:hypothetical protein